MFINHSTFVPLVPAKSVNKNNYSRQCINSKLDDKCLIRGNQKFYSKLDDKCLIRGNQKFYSKFDDKCLINNLRGNQKFFYMLQEDS